MDHMERRGRAKSEGEHTQESDRNTLGGLGGMGWMGSKSKLGSLVGTPKSSWDKQGGGGNVAQGQEYITQGGDGQAGWCGWFAQGQEGAGYRGSTSPHAARIQLRDLDGER
ncbi:hypothetical protein B484DRAFT_450952 [Ochromonadaceae sp. CCMP2298]|nr:hypothetical protein B484DRAFT_450952 [Ochromonadaceae sp. CCMP2298]